MEKTKLSKHRADTAHLPHHPLNGFVTRCRVLRQEFAGFFSQVDQDGTGLKQGQRLAAWAIGVKNGGDLVVGAERNELGCHLVIGGKADQMYFIGQAGFFQHDGHLDTIGCGQ